jgi:PBP1b-binding outer membrane lipoprotein LpoB
MWAVIRIMVLALAAVVLAGCATSAQSANQQPTTTAEPARVPVGTVVMVIRHGEKPDESSEGIDPPATVALPHQPNCPVPHDRARRLYS